MQGVTSFIEPIQKRKAEKKNNLQILQKFLRKIVMVSIFNDDRKVKLSKHQLKNETLLNISHLLFYKVIIIVLNHMVRYLSSHYETKNCFN